ncbi:DUF4822 domain-containing protein [Sphingobacterium rhinopitheci]|uniref:DUF4822 domain-containing protein n=1 Tax=Sphingobacterium rhinopitheci TaxID=2781960 RepID=UPI001F52162B|nr:DUF4822 domain-containing protein [Sphingobacterium rhinopitheci]
MKNTKKFTIALLFGFLGIVLFSCNNKNDPAPEESPSQILASVSWQTTGARNEKGENVELTNENVIPTVGYAYFKSNGTFTIFSLDDAPRIQGDWSVTADGKTRTITAKNAAGGTLFTRDVEIIVLTRQEFTYRIYPNENDRSVYLDIIHTPTTHVEPTFTFTPSQILASVSWETTSAKNNQGATVPLTNPNVINFVGYAYFKTNGSFIMVNLDDSPKLQGTWSVSADGKTRTLVALNDDNEVLFTRVVDITVLTTTEFTYRIYPNNNDRTVYFDIVHTPTDHVEP